mmetsp:Transcript_116355/g.329148  ORF Transcript_116355/g.329148 Transcript_116355/m.329148 type:complete len:273 (+) Transcript_116355:115-933(+)
MRDASHLLRVLQILAHDIPSEARRRVVHRVVIRARLPTAIRRANLHLVLAASELGVQYAHRDAGGAQVLLDAGVNASVLGDLDGLRHEVRRHVPHQRHGANVGRVRELNAVHRLVGTVVDVRGLGVQLPVLLSGDDGEFGGLRVARLLARAVLVGLLVRLLAPLARDEVVGLRLQAHHVERDAGKLQGGAALLKNHLVVVGHAENVPKILLGLLGNTHELLRAVRHLHDAHAALLVVEHVRLDRLQDLKGHLARAGREIVDTPLRHISNAVA